MEQLEQISPAENRSSSWCQSKWSWKEHRGDFSSSMLLYKRVASTIDAPQSPVPTRPANHQLVNVHLWIVSASVVEPWSDPLASCAILSPVALQKELLRVRFNLNPGVLLNCVSMFQNWTFLIASYLRPANEVVTIHQLWKGMRWSVISSSIPPGASNLHCTIQSEYLVSSTKVSSIDVPRSFDGHLSSGWLLSCTSVRHWFQIQSLSSFCCDLYCCNASSTSTPSTPPLIGIIIL